MATKYLPLVIKICINSNMIQEFIGSIFSLCWNVQTHYGIKSFFSAPQFCIIPLQNTYQPAIYGLTMYNFALPSRLTATQPTLTSAYGFIHRYRWAKLKLFRPLLIVNIIMKIFYTDINLHLMLIFHIVLFLPLSLYELEHILVAPFTNKV